MKCPHCGAWTDLLETRKRVSTGLTYRRYECANTHRFSTEDGHVVRVDVERLPSGRPRKETPCKAAATNTAQATVATKDAIAPSGDKPWAA